MKLKSLFVTLGLSLALGTSALLPAFNASKETKVANAASAQPGDAPTGAETDWTPVTSVSDINTNDFYMLRTTNNDSYQYAGGTLAFVNGVALYTETFENARMFKFVQGTNGYKISGLFDLSDAELENCHYLDINEGGLWVTDTEADAAEFNGYAYDGAKITLQEHGTDYLLAALPINNGDRVGMTMILNFDSEMYSGYSEFTVPLELVTIASPKVLSLKVNDGWASDGARFAAYFFGNGDTWVDMTLVSGSTRLYEVTAPNGYPSVIFCRMDGSKPENNWDNKLNQTGNLSVADGDYYLMYDDSWDTGIWHDGSRDVYVEGDFTDPTWTALDANKLTWNRLSGQYEFKAYNALNKDANFKIVDVTTDTWRGYSDDITNDLSLFTEGTDSNIVCASNTAYDIYYKPQHYSIWIEEDQTIAADHFAITFLDTTNGICVDSSKSASDTDLNDLKAVWNAKESPDGSSLVEKWNALSIGAKGTFAKGTATENITNAYARYVHIMSRYSNALTPFSGGPAYSANLHITLNDALSNNSISIILVASFITLIALSAVALLKKRKAN